MQNDYKVLLHDNENLKVENKNLNHFVIKLTDLHKEAKEENKRKSENYNELQNQYKEILEKHTMVRLKLQKKYYTLLILCVVIFMLLIIFVLPDIVVGIVTIFDMVVK